MEKLNSKKNIKEKDYRTYILSKKEKIRCIVLCAGVSIIISLLFYKTIFVAVIFMLAVPFALKKYSEILLEKRKEKLKSQFVSGMSAYASAIRSGYSAENAVREARIEIERMDGKEGILASEFRLIERKLSYRESIEGALTNLSKRTGIEEIEDMASVFAVSKRYGGSLSEVVTNAVNILKEKKKVAEEITTMMTSKRLEYRIMCLMPAGILLYVNLSSPEFISMLYEGILGRGAMTLLLASYIAAILIGERMMKIEI